MTDELVKRAREILAGHLRKLNGGDDADEVMRGEWDNGADIKALAESLADNQSQSERIDELEGERDRWKAECKALCEVVSQNTRTAALTKEGK